MEYDQKENFVASLADNEGLSGIISTIILNDGIDFEILVSSYPKRVEFTIEYIQKELAKEGVSKEFVYILRGYHGVAQTLEGIQETLGGIKSGSDRVYVFDFSLYGECYKHEIEMLFSKLNELRNTILHRLNSSILFILPPLYKINFITSAPDFWSIAKYMVDIDNGSFGEPPKEEYKEPKIKRSDTQSALAKLLEEQYELSHTPSSNITQKLLLINAHTLGDHYNDYGDLDDALSCYHRGYKISQTISDRHPDSIEAKRDVSVSLEKIANIQLQKGEVEQALRG